MLAIILTSFALLAYSSGSSGSSFPAVSSSPTESAEAKTAAQQKAENPPVQEPFVKPPVSNVPLSHQHIFTSPGLATIKDGNWVGSEHLLQVKKTIGIVVEIVHPPSIASPTISEEKIREEISQIFNKAGITPVLDLVANPTPLPFFHFLVLINPIEKGYAAYCAGRLFEDCDPDRATLRLPKNSVFQAITWEKQELLIFGADQLMFDLQKSANTMSSAFAERFKSYSNIK